MSDERFSESSWRVDKRPIETKNVGFWKKIFCHCDNYTPMNRAEHLFYPGEYTSEQCPMCYEWRRVGTRTFQDIVRENRRLGK
jgi:hypothetical protein